MVFTMSLRVQIRSKRCALGLSFFRDERQYTEQSTDNQADQEKVNLIYQQQSIMELSKILMQQFININFNNFNKLLIEEVSL